jgi:hypothetical protein
MAGRKPKATEQKRRTGNPGKRSLPAKAELVAVPPVDGSVVEITPEQAFERSLIAGAHWLADSEAATVVLARDALELYGELRADPKAKTADVIAAGKWVQSLFGDLAFNPGERARLGLAEVKAVSKMEELSARRAQRAKVVDTGS